MAVGIVDLRRAVGRLPSALEPCGIVGVGYGCISGTECLHWEDSTTVPLHRSANIPDVGVAITSCNLLTITKPTAPFIPFYKTQFCGSDTTLAVTLVIDV